MTQKTEKSFSNKKTGFHEMGGADGVESIGI